MIRDNIAEGEIYHVFNRGTDKRKIFLDAKNYERFLVNLVLFNTAGEVITNVSRYDLAQSYLNIPDNPLVKILAFALLPNHFHFILEPLVKDGIKRFMHRLEMGYAQYFNRLNKRSGNLFQGAYKIIHVDNEAYLNFLPLYVHLNPLDLLPSEFDWKEKGIKNKKGAINFLKNYKWSSLQTYVSLKEQPFVDTKLFSYIYESPKVWERELANWLPGNNPKDLPIE